MFGRINHKDTNFFFPAPTVQTLGGGTRFLSYIIFVILYTVIMEVMVRDHILVGTDYRVPTKCLRLVFCIRDDIRLVR